MPRARELEKIGATERINVRITTQQMAKLQEMLQTWYPDRTRLQGAVVGQAIDLLYKQFQREQKREG